MLTKALTIGRVQQIFRALLYGNRALAHARLQHQREAAADDEKASFARTPAAKEEPLNYFIMMAIHAQVLHLNSDPGAADTDRDALKAVPKDASAGGKPHPQVAYHLPRLRQIAGQDA